MDRNLSEPNRALAQWMRNIDKQVRRLQSTASKPGQSRSDTCVRMFYDNVIHNPVQDTDGWWADHEMCEVDLDPGAWVIMAELQFEVFYTHAAGQLGYQLPQLAIFTTPLDGAVKTEAVRFKKSPMAQPVDLGVGSTETHWFDLLNVHWKVSSDTGLTITMAGRLEIANGTAGVTNGPDLWLGPGHLLAIPL